MVRKFYIAIIPALFFILLFLSSFAAAEVKRTLVLENFDQLNRQVTDSGNVWYGVGHIRLRLDSTYISSDSLVWLRDRNIIHFFGNVNAYDSVQQIRGEQLSYYHQDSMMIARKNVVLIHSLDSIMAESQIAEYDRSAQVVTLDGNPRLYLNYPDTANMVEITADHLTFFPEERNGEAEDNVVIIHQNTRATCGCAEFSQRENLLVMRDEPRAVRDSSDIAGQLMRILFSRAGVREIDVFDDATAYFIEGGDSTGAEYSGDTRLSGENIKFYFEDDQIRKIAAMGAARSEYYPAPEDTSGSGKNFVSGDTIFIYIAQKRITKAEIKGGAEGLYITKSDRPPDSTMIDSTSSEDASAPEPTMAIAPDSISSDSSQAATGDTLLAADSVKTYSTPEDTIRYNGNYLEYFAANRIIRITGNASVKQGEVSLKADRVDYDVPRRVVLAKAGADTVDSNVKIRPLSLKDGSEEIFGSQLVFNVDTKKGKIENATTKYEMAYYRGQDLFKEDEKVFYVEDGQLSSCELEEPHFHFSCRKMKLIHNDRVIARPVTLYIETIPTLTIPYYIFPLKRGRHSGILPIKLGNFEQGSRFIGNLGYYWAASDYWDLQTSLDFYENIGITINNYFRYNKRYAYNGRVQASVSRDRQESAFKVNKRDRWRITGSHAQTLPYEIDFRASGEFVSDKNYNTDYSNDPNERLNRNIISKANFNKKFGRSSVSLSFSHTNNLDDDSRESRLPTGSFTMPSFNPFGSGKEVDGKTIKKWYNYFYVGYRNNFGIVSSQKYLTDTQILPDSTTLETRTRTWKDYGYIDHGFSLSAPQKLFKYLTIGPSMSMQETWYYILKSDQAQAAGIPADRPYRRASISASLGTNTDLYGTLNVNRLGLVALRHVISPSLSFGWNPAITKNDAVKRFTGQGGGGAKSKSLSFGLQNLFQAKVKSGDTQKKIDLVRINSNLSYNFEAKLRKFSNLNTSISSTLLKNVSMQGGLVHDLYDQNNELNWRAPSLRSFNFSASFQARGSVADDYTRQGLNSDFDEDTLGLSAGSGLNADLSAPPLSGGSGGAQWNMNVSYSYSEYKSYGATTNRTHWIQYTFNMGLTRNWKIKYSQRYDFVRQESIDKMVDLYRKMHCWEGHFYWIPNGSRQGYYFKINVIAIPDIKVEKSESGLRGALFNR